MEEFVQEQRVRSVAIGTERFHKFRHPEVQALEVIRPPFGRFHMHVMTGRAADIANAGLVAVLDLAFDKPFPMPAKA